jgi:6-phosphogluconolactonase (cycloisomerase 2 family)
VIWRGDLNFTLEAPGPVPDRQAAAHPHQALFDPTGKFIVVPDLGADLIRLFAVQPSAPMGVAEIAPVKVRPGTGPRHGVFWPRTGRARFYYLVGELDNTVTTFKVRYTKAGMQFTQTQTLSTLPAGYNSPNPAYAGEIVLSPSQNHIYVSNRLDTVFPDSNSIAAYGIPDIRDGKSTGALSQHEFFPSGVNNTRHFTIHPRGQWILNAGSVSNDIKTWRLDERSGRVLTGQSMGGKVFSIEKPVCLTWL